jgi:NTP pyrophosphatase (non-canonical NTP hydrolase)
VSDLENLISRFRQFSRDRDWEKFHDPRSLILALVGEVGELAELFQWQLTDDPKSSSSAGSRHQRASEEIADVFLYLIRLADVLDIDVLEAASQKLSASEARFPVDQVSGIAPDKVG